MSEGSKIVYMIPDQSDYERLITAITQTTKDVVESALANTPEKPMRFKEAADYLGIDPECLRRRIKSGIIPAYKNGGTIYFFRSELDQIIKSNKVK